MTLVPKNLVIAVALLAAGFFGAYLRFRPHLGNDALYTDGTSVYEGAVGERIRYAVWDEPLPLSIDVNTAGAESRPSISPDGRLLVFAAGEPGLNADLYVADLVDGEPVDPRPLAALNTDWDETAPCFGADALWFASNRPGSAGGLDLFRAPYSGGSFGPVTVLDAALNTEAHETDPAPIPGSSAVAFSSDRKRGLRSDYDLFLAREVREGDTPSWRVSAFEELNSPFDDREPSFTSDGRTVVFASERDGSTGGFDLYRSLQERGTWLTPELLPGLNSEADERGPFPSQDGFSMLFSIQGADAQPDLFRARSLELFRRPGRPVGWLDLLILAALLTLALLAYLAKRWETLEALYKCFLVSMLAHMLLLWWLQDVFVEGGAVDLKGSSALFQVSLASSSQSASEAQRARDGRLEVARAESAWDQQAPERAAGPAPQRSEARAQAEQLQRSEQSAPDAPERAEASDVPQPVPQETATFAVREAVENFERLAGEAPALDVNARAIEAQRTEATPANAERAPSVATLAATSDERPAPAQESLQQPERVAAVETPEASRRTTALPRTDTAEASVVTVAQPTETAVRRAAAAAPAFDLPTPTTHAAAARPAAADASSGAPARSAPPPGAPRRVLRCSRPRLPRSGRHGTRRAPLPGAPGGTRGGGRAARRARAA